MSLFRMPWAYVPDPTMGRPLFGGEMYFGIVDQDPTLFPKDVSIIQEGNPPVTAEQPILINSGGVPTYNGSVAAIELTGDYSLSIRKNGSQVYYLASLTETDNNLTENALRAAALRLNLDATLIGTVLITNQAGQDLDEAEYLLDTVTGLLYSLPGDIPVGSTVISSSGTTLITSNGQFEMQPVLFPAVNRLKGNQLPVVEGSTNDPLPNGTPTPYDIDSEPAFGWKFITAATGVTFENGLWKGTTGQLQRAYGRDSAGFISKASEYGGVKLHDDTQLRALVDDIATNGCSITDDVDNVYVTFDLAKFPNGVKFPGLSGEVGAWPDIGNDEAIASISIDLTNSRNWQDESLNRAFGAAYTNTDKVTKQVYAAITVGTSSAISISWAVNALTIPGPNVVPTSGNTITTPTIDITPGDLYSLSKFGGDPSDVLSWYELEK